jgi:hypothetical protein
VWIVNDEHQALDGLLCEAYLRASGKEVLVARRDRLASVPEDSVADVGWLGFKLPPAVAPGGYELVLLLKQGDRTLSENTYPVTVVE